MWDREVQQNTWRRPAFLSNPSTAAAIGDAVVAMAAKWEGWGSWAALEVG
jgi:hypothetical protein